MKLSMRPFNLKLIKYLTRYDSNAQMSTSILSRTVDKLDQTQLELLEEMCIVVDENDKAVGAKSKKDCHLMENINKGIIHRAFSVLLFNSKNEFLLTQRSDQKITFPGFYTNTCCSHPLDNNLEREENDAIGVKRAAQRRLNIELGIDPLQIPLKDFTYLTRFLYKAQSNGGLWGEHEIDYVLIIRKDVSIKPNLNEVKNFHYLPQKDLLPFLENAKEKGEHTTPWFQIMVDNFLFKWWNNLDNLQKFKNTENIHRLV